MTATNQQRAWNSSGWRDEGHPGGESRYNSGCRCGDCKSAHAKAEADRRTRRVAATATGWVAGEHGRYTTYKNHGCRCAKCKAAMSAYNAELRRRNRAVQS